MLILTDRAEIFLDRYLINTRWADGSYSCACRHADGRTLKIETTRRTEEDALKFCQAAVIQDFIRHSKTPQVLVKVCTSSQRIVAVNGLAEKLLGGKLIGHSYNWFPPVDRETLERDGVCRRTVQCIDLDGRLMKLEVSEQLINLAGVVLILSTIDQINS